MNKSIDTEKEDGFKLIAIRTGSKLSNEEIQSFDSFPYIDNSRSVPAPYNYLKNLTPNETFLLFNDYSIDKAGNTLTHIPEKSIPNIYRFKKNSETKLTISSIIGKNGSGKSTLLEILYVAIHNLAVATEVLYDSDIVKVEEPQHYLRCELYVLTDESTSFKIKFDDKASRPCVISEAKKTDNEFEYQELKHFDKTILERLFYSIAVNYSIYGLNSKHLGSWITHLFHKNDSYQTPLVINPMRTDGNFDINREEYLSKYRLLSNSIIKYQTYKSDITIADEIKLKKLIFKLDQRKIANLESRRIFEHSNSKESKEKSRSIYDLIDKSNLKKSKSEISELAVHLLLNKKIISTNIPYQEQIENYIVKKLYRIAFNYSKYWVYLDYGDYPMPVIFETNFKTTTFEEYLVALAKDTTHITLKLRQALNYLVNNPLGETISSNGTTYKFREVVGGKIYDTPFIVFAEKLFSYDDNIIHCIPPSLFDIAIFVSDESKQDKENFNMKYLSSGQLQLIHSVQSSLYHINNLESYKALDSEDERIKYKNVLILFDEVELYFHPEYQQKIIDFFIKQLDELNFNQIKSIHVIYITHSPFLLSDIPHTNQLTLIEGESGISNKTTFGANIHDLLADSFFLNESFMGTFAEHKINKIIRWINDHVNLKKSEELVRDDAFYQKYNDYKKIIELIGERVLRLKLIEMISVLDDDRTEFKKMIKNEINRLTNLIEE